MRIRIKGSQFTRLMLLQVVLAVGFLSFIFSSCKTPRNVTYFRDIPDSVQKRLVDQASFNTPVIQADDIIQVSIQTLDASSTSMLNQPSATTSAPMTGSTTSSTPSAVNGVNGYLVDKDGYVVLPLLGKIMVAGKATSAVRDEIQKKAAEYYKEPVVDVRLANFKITVLGEVNRPSTYVMPNEKVTVLDAIGVAGDLTIYGKRENVLLIRETNNKKELVRLNLNNSSLFASPYFYLHQGDVVYVEPDNAKVRSTDMAQVKRISILSSVLALIVVIVSRVNFN